MSYAKWIHPPRGDQASLTPTRACASVLRRRFDQGPSLQEAVQTRYGGLHHFQCPLNSSPPRQCSRTYRQANEGSAQVNELHTAARNIIRQTRIRRESFPGSVTDCAKTLPAVACCVEALATKDRPTAHKRPFPRGRCAGQRSTLLTGMI